MARVLATLVVILISVTVGFLTGILSTERTFGKYYITNNNIFGVSQDARRNTPSENDPSMPTPSLSDACYSPEFLDAVQAALDRLPWSEFEKTTLTNNYLPANVVSQILATIIPFLDIDLKPPSNIPKNVSAYYNDGPVNCSAIPPELAPFSTGKKRFPPAKLFDLCVFAYELDVLELRLYELESVVDYFALLESTHTHRAARKLLTYARNEHRFRRWSDKILQFVGDFSNWGREQAGVGNYWYIEGEQRHLTLRKLIAALPPGYIQPHDLILNGDLDEIPNGRLLRYIKECDVNVPLAFNTQVNIRSSEYFFFFETHIFLVLRTELWMAGILMNFFLSLSLFFPNIHSH